MNRTARALALLAVVAMVACAACWFTARHLERQARLEAVEAHLWVHSQLKITPEQDKALSSI